MDVVDQLIRSTFGPSTIVVTREPLAGRNVGRYYTEDHPHLSRCTLPGGPTAPHTVIVKTRRAEADSRADPRFLRNERAALEFLTAIGNDAAPRYIAGDDAAGVVIMEDLGNGLSPDLLLVGEDPGAALDGLTAFARSLGRLHARTVGRASDFYQIRAALGPVDPAADRFTYGGAPVIETWDALKECVRTLPAAPDPRHADADVDALIHTLSDPGDYLALSNGDVCPQNARLFGDVVRFLDFEGAVFRHALLDAAYLRFPFVDCPCRSMLPSDVRQHMESTYRKELAEVCAAVQDDASFEHGITVACAAKTIQRALGFPSVADADATYGMGVSKRAWLLTSIETLTTCSERSGSLGQLSAWFADLAQVLREQWRNVPPAVPLYPAFTKIAEK